MRQGIVSLGLIAIIFISFSATNAQAFRVTPMLYDLEPFGQKASKTMRVENTTAKSLTIEIIPQKRVINPDGSEERTVAEDDFLIFPPQAIIEPGKVQAVKVTYIGEPDIPSSVGYLITVSQLPIELTEEEQSGVQITYKFGASVNIVPKDSSPEIAIQSVEASGSEAKLILKNNGTRYERISLGKWTFTNANGETHEFVGDSLKEQITQGLTQPGTERHISFTFPDTFNTNGLKASYTLQEDLQP